MNEARRLARSGAMGAFYVRASRAGVLTTAFTLAALVVYLLLPGNTVNDTAAFAVAVVVAGGVMAVAAWLPWDRLVVSDRAPRTFALWLAGNVVLISIGVAASGGGRSDLYLMYALTTVFVALAPGRGTQYLLVAFTVAGYTLALWATGWDVAPATLAWRLGFLVVSGHLAVFLGAQLLMMTEAHEAAEEESRVRARLLAVVARAGGLRTLDPAEVAEAVMDSVVALGFRSASLNEMDEEQGSFRTIHQRNMPATLLGTSHDVDAGLTGIVRREGRTVVVDDYQDHPASRGPLRDIGITSAIMSPIRVDGRIVATLGAGRRARGILPEEVEAFELLASQCGAALEKSHRFEAERQTVERLAELDHLKRDFVATASHELRTPLTVIKGMGETLSERWAEMDDATRFEFLGRLNANAAALTEVVDTLLDFARLEAGRLDVRPRPVHLSEVLRATARRLEPLFAHHELAVDLDADLEVVADPTLLDRVVENLLANAAKHTPAGTRVRLSSRAEDHAAVISVTDNGPGVSPEDLPNLFMPFFRGGNHDTRRTRGTGIGLAFAREVVALHGAELEITSEPGEGATFSFRLPLATGARPRGAQ